MVSLRGINALIVTARRTICSGERVEVFVKP
jgi:hypothetical protein